MILSLISLKGTAPHTGGINTAAYTHKNNLMGAPSLACPHYTCAFNSPKLNGPSMIDTVVQGYTGGSALQMGPQSKA